MKHHIYILFLLLLVFSSCERRIEYKGEITQPKLVLQAEVSEGDTIVKAYVSRSRFFLDDKPYNSSEDYRMLSATVELQRGNQTWQPLESYSIEPSQGNSGDKFFAIRLDAPLKAGETIRIRASHPDYETITAQQTIVHKPWCQVLDFNGQKNTLSKNNALHYIELSLLLQNYPFEDAHLGVNIACMYHLFYFKNGTRRESGAGTTTYIRSYDKLFANPENTSTTQTGFSSRFELFAQSDYENAYLVNMEIPYSAYPQNVDSIDIVIDSLVVSFNAHSYDSYLYRMSMYKARGEQQNDDGDLGAALSDILGQEEEVQIYSNIVNGYGIFANCSRYKIVMKNIKTVSQ